MAILSETKQIYLTFFKRVIAYRNKHKSKSTQIAHYAYGATHEQRVGFSCSVGVQSLRGEMITFEVPGLSPDDNVPPEVYEDMLWSRLGKMIDVEMNKTGSY